MANGASRIFKLMQNAGTDTVSEMVYLTVKSTNPLIFNLEDRLDITEEFYVLNDNIIKERLNIGDVLTATTFNNGQKYLINQGLKKDMRRKIVDNLSSTSDIDGLSANQGRILLQIVNELKNKVDTLQNEVGTLQEKISEIENKI